MTNVGYPVTQLGEIAETALEKAKAFKADGKTISKNAVNIYGISVGWNIWKNLGDLQQEIERLGGEFSLSIAYLYALIHLADQAYLASQS